MSVGVRARRAGLAWLLLMSAVLVTTSDVVGPAAHAAPAPVADVIATPAPVAVDHGLPTPSVAAVTDVSFTVDLALQPAAARAVAKAVSSVVVATPLGGAQSPKTPPVGLVGVHVRDEKVATAAGGAKVAFTVTAADVVAAGQSTAVTIDYSSFANAFGGVWSQRLVVLQAPACALTTPELAECQLRVPVQVSNDWRGQTLSLTIPVDASPKLTAAGSQTATSSSPSSEQPAAADPVAANTAATPSVGGEAAVAPGAAPGGGGTAYVMSSSPIGAAGTFAATPLSAASSWNVGLGSGSFDYSFPVPMVPAPHGSTPSLGLSYSSQKMDGMTVTSNNQSGPAGLGFDLSTGTIDRRFKPCVLAGGAILDECSYGDNAVISYAGHSSELVKTSDTSANESEWQLQESPRWRVTRFSGTLGMPGNGDNDGAWWRIITPDGTVTTFGRNTVIGDPTVLNSTLIIPVTSISSDGPCYASTSHTCGLAWRWMADSVTDTKNNAQTYFYSKETNYYGAKGGNVPVVYDMAARLTRVEYGETVGGLFTTSDVGVTLSYQYRCIDLASTCEAPTPTNGNRFPDVPNDLICPSSGTCVNHMVSYFTAYRLVAIDTWSREGDVYAYADRIQLAHDWTCIPSSSNPAVCDINGGGFPTELYLRNIQRWGSPSAPTAPALFPTVGGTGLPPIRFDSTYSDSTDWTGNVITSPFANRADASPTNGVYPQYVPRITQVRDELGSLTLLTYGQPSGCIGKPPAGFPATGFVDNGTNCFPDWTVNSTPNETNPGDAGWGLFNKFVVTKITVRDMTPGSTDQITRYSYADSSTTAAYRYTDSKWATYRTYSDWRGYSRVIVRHGDDAASTQTRYLLFRGMNGDLDKNTGQPRAVTVDGINDEKWYSGITRETRTMRVFNANDPGNFDTGTVETSVVNLPVVLSTTGTAPLQAHLVDIAQTDTYTNAAASSGDARPSPLKSTVVTTFGAYLEPETITESGFNTATRCRRLDYAIVDTPNATMVNRVRGNRLYDGACDPNPNTTGDLNVPHSGYTLAASIITYFDGHTNWNDAPTLGNPTRSDLWTGTTNLQTLMTYDARGRMQTMTDPKGYLSTTAYNTTAGPYHTTTVTNPKGWTNVTTTDPRRATVSQTVDANSNVNHESYDGLGRLTAMWRDGLTTATTPSVKFQYNINVPIPATHEENALPVPGHVVQTTTTQTVSPLVQIDSFVIVDSLGRTRQTQTRSTTAGKLIITGDTTWDARGLTTTAWQPYSSTAPSPLTYLTAALSPAASRPAGPISTMGYDQLGRATTATQTSAGETTMVATTGYDGWNTTTDPPGLTAATRTERDAYGRTFKTVELAAATGVDAVTAYTYTPRDETTTIKDNSNYTTTMTYDWAGRRTNTVDPNAGASSVVYDNDGNITSTTDARNTTLTYNYDNLNRKTAELSGATALAQWAYDPTGARGQLASSTRNDPVRGAYTTVYTYDAQYWVNQKAITLPASETPLNGTYTYTYTYNTQGKQLTVNHPATGGLAAETVTTAYDTLGNPNSLTSPAVAYLSATTRNDIGQTTARSLGGIIGGTVNRGYAYDGYQRLQQLTTSAAGAPATLSQSLTYRYDAAGNIASIADGSTTGSGQRECFTYDTRSRLTLAYTTTTVNPDQTCGANNTSGPTPYNEIDAFDWLGRMTKHNNIAYSYGDTAHPYAPTMAGSVTYTYNQIGAAATRSTTGSPSQTLAWDVEGRLSSITTSTCAGGPPCVNSNIYDADGQRLIRRNSDGTATAYLSDGDELTKVNSTTKTEQRTYTTADGTIVGVRTTVGYNVTTTDHHNTPTTSTAPTGTPTARRFSPYGNSRNPAPAWPNDHTFLNQVNDSTALVYLNNRYYDPDAAIFISVDLLVAATRTPYSYAQGNPVSLSDATGLGIDGCPGTGAPDNSGHCVVSETGRFTIANEFQGKAFSATTIPFAPVAGVGSITIDLFIAAYRAGGPGAYDEGNDRPHCMGCAPDQSKVQVVLDFDKGSAYLIAAPTCDAAGKGCHDARPWQQVSAGEKIVDSANNVMVTQVGSQVRVQIRAKNSRRDSVGGFDAPSIDDAYVYNASTLAFKGRGDMFPSETIYQTRDGENYLMSTHNEKLTRFDTPGLFSATWKNLLGWNPI